GAWGQQALVQVEALFDAWHRFQRGALDREGFQRAMAPVQAAVHALLQPEATQGKAKLVGMAAELQALWPALWTFVTVPGVVPTNNAAERQLRPGVLWRKGCYGTQSPEGDRFVERILTVSATCQQQQRPLFPYLVDALTAHQLGHSGPRLLPIP